MRRSGLHPGILPGLRYKNEPAVHVADDPYETLPELVDMTYHLLYAMIVDQGIVWRSACPEAHLDYRARRCSVGDLGCILEAVLDDGVDPLEFFEGRIENPQFPLKVTVGYDNYEDAITIHEWEG